MPTQTRAQEANVEITVTLSKLAPTEYRRTVRTLSCEPEAREKNYESLSSNTVWILDRARRHDVRVGPTVVTFPVPGN